MKRRMRWMVVMFILMLGFSALANFGRGNITGMTISEGATYRIGSQLYVVTGVSGTQVTLQKGDNTGPTYSATLGEEGTLNFPSDGTLPELNGGTVYNPNNPPSTDIEDSDNTNGLSNHGPITEAQKALYDLAKLTNVKKLSEQDISEVQKATIRLTVNNILKSAPDMPLSELYDYQSNYGEYAPDIQESINTRHNQLINYVNNPETFGSSELSNKERDAVIRDANTWYASEEANKKAGMETEFNFEAAKENIEQLQQQRWESRTFYERMNTIYQGATAGRYLADKMGIEAFEWSERFFQGTFGKFITGEPPAGICDKPIRKAGSTQGVIVDNSLIGNIVAHVEGEKTKIVDPEGNVEYFYKITLQIKPEKKEDKVTYNVDLYSNNALQTAIFKQEQSKQGTVNHVGETAFIQYSGKDYDKLCLRSSVGNTCNRFADVTEFAQIEASSNSPSSAARSSSGQAGEGTSTTNEW